MTTDRPPLPLTPRQGEVLQLLAEGLTHQEIATKLYITGGTVKTHVLRLYERLGASNAPSAVSAAYRLGLLATNGHLLHARPALWCPTCGAFARDTSHRHPTHPVAVQVLALTPGGAPC